MCRAAGPWVVATSVLVAGHAAAGARQQFRTAVDLVHVPVIVTGRDGTLVRGLTRDDFVIREDGRAQQVSYFAEGAPGESLPLHVGLVLDTSGSMDRDLREVQGAAVQFVRALEEAADVTLIDFDTSVRVGRFLPASYPMLFERIRSLKTGGRTSLYDAVGVYLEGSLARPGQHVLLLYTDGGDSASRLSFGKLQELLRRANVIVYALGYLEHQSSTERTALRLTVSRITRETGGEAFFPSSAAEIHEFYARILDELQSRYTLGYVSDNPRADGRFRRLEVSVTAPRARNARLRARTGYMAPGGGPG
jgi:VWFA-related protein